VVLGALLVLFCLLTMAQRGDDSGDSQDQLEYKLQPKRDGVLSLVIEAKNNPTATVNSDREQVDSPEASILIRN